MNVTPTTIPEVLLIEPRVHEDDRGLFFESFNQRDFARETGVDAHFVQDNHSRSARHVLRGMHYQVVQPQGKLVRVAYGAVFDVALDLRPRSPTFLRSVGLELTALNRRQLWIPPGFAHGYLVLSEFADFLYKTTKYYSPAHERCVRWDDPAFSIAWPLSASVRLSTRDANAAPVIFPGFSGADEVS
ncbi:dTDP-4-dehydrorhamnose 3,5-epimerase [Polaromonas aquatica]|uniref:dTDP-4-dehydrorhamnose 3,5-epimerase n=1 Tax=Polaromonas aquatica TaxID=332657 RepID=UPI003D653508